jgi:cysteine desulfurase
MNGRIYLDHAATTPLRAEARAAMEPYLGAAAFGNPSSLHADGQAARRALDDARDTVAHAIGAAHSEICFTSGGTEADNAALVGVMLANRGRGDHLVTTQIEHEAVLRTCRFLETLGFRVTYLPPNEHGQVTAEQVEAALTPETVLVSVMHANNETGVLQPIRAIGQIARSRGVFFHTDAVQSFGQIPIDVDDLCVDLLSLSAHKIYGPKGAGALYVRSGVPIEPLLHGGAQERERRAGTENVAAIAGFAEAVRLLLAERSATAARMRDLRDALIRSLTERIPDARLNGHPSERLPNNINVSFDGCDNESVLLSLDRAGISASSGSACSSGSIEPSHVLLAMGLLESRVRGAVRLTLGRDTNPDELDRTVDALTEIVRRVRTPR